MPIVLHSTLPTMWNVRVLIPPPMLHYALSALYIA